MVDHFGWPAPAGVTMQAPVIPTSVSCLLCDVTSLQACFVRFPGFWMVVKPEPVLLDCRLRQACSGYVVLWMPVVVTWAAS
jgi:hypothetical protein